MRWDWNIWSCISRLDNMGDDFLMLCLNLEDELAKLAWHALWLIVWDALIVGEDICQTCASLKYLWAMGPVVKSASEVIFLHNLPLINSCSILLIPPSHSGVLRTQVGRIKTLQDISRGPAPSYESKASFPSESDSDRCPMSTPSCQWCHS